MKFLKRLFNINVNYDYFFLLILRPLGQSYKENIIINYYYVKQLKDCGEVKNFVCADRRLFFISLLIQQLLHKRILLQQWPQLW